MQKDKSKIMSVDEEEKMLNQLKHIKQSNRRMNVCIDCVHRNSVSRSFCLATKPMFNEVALAEEMKMSIMYANVDEVKQC